MSDFLLFFIFSMFIFCLFYILLLFFILFFLYFKMISCLVCYFLFVFLIFVIVVYLKTWVCGVQDMFFLSFVVFVFKNLSIVSFFIFFLLISFLFLFFLLLFFIYDFSSFLIDWQFFVYLGVEIELSFLFDWVSVSFSFVVCFISFSVVWFSLYYMFGDQYIFRFIWLVFLFVLSMVFFVFIPNLISLLIGWDGLGVISFCLVVYYHNFKSLVSGVLTVLVNRIGDVMILLSIGWIFSFGSWNFFFLDDFFCGAFVALCLVLAGMTKSAQFPFCSWLPAAMAAPTPVSALVHSSTLVTAGVFLIIRFWDFISMYYFVVFFLQLFSLVTITLSGFSAMFETDLKKIIALSTLSQLGVMLFSVSFGFCFFGLFHLYVHALFKALLFLCAGCLIHFFSHVQDIRHLGCCWSLVPFVMFFFNLASLALCGFPFFGGFYSKDMILEVSLFLDYNFLFLFFFFFSTSLTIGYSVRLVLFSFFGVLKINSLFSKDGDGYSFMMPIIFLGFGALFGGFMFYFFIFESKCFFFFPSILDKLFVFFVVFFGVFVGFFFFFFSFSNFFAFFSNFGCSMWYLGLVTTQGVLFFPFFFFFRSYYFLDRGYYELLGGYGLSYYTNFVSYFFGLISFKSIFISVSFFLFFIFFFFNF